ncbi:MAG: redox-regulated ATPase YchF [Candidatus Nanohaloarchaea archaeon]|nr:redox-regulated ATPase YchF [Candidatus Nanohaloarchaea archaeon]
MELGIVGKPNTGKSTLFKAITRKDIEAANYPFTTIEPNRGVAFASTQCPCQELDVDCDPNGRCVDGTRFVPVNVLDIAGLVPGASEGKGMGNEFLDAVREADALIHVLDCAGKTNAKGEPAEDYDPVQDVTFVEDEFDAWMEQVLRDGWESAVRSFRSSDAGLDEFLAEQLSGLGVKREHVQDALRTVDVPEQPDAWEEDDFAGFVEAVRREAKPALFACNKIDLPGADENLERLREEHPSLRFVPISAAAELTLRRAAEAGKIDYVPGADDFEIVADLDEEQEQGLERIRSAVLQQYGGTGVQRLIDEALFELLERIVVYPVEDTGKYANQEGDVLPDAVLVEKGATPVDLAYAIHSDIGDSYVKAVDARTGQALGKDHELENGDVVKIVT